MYKITDKRYLTENIYLMDIEAPRVAKSAKPGQFIIIRNDKKAHLNGMRFISAAASLPP